MARILVLKEYYIINKNATLCQKTLLYCVVEMLTEVGMLIS